MVVLSKHRPLKKFIDEHILKDYINFKRLENGYFGLYTPRKTKDLNCDYEAIFKAYENYQFRNYRGYKFRDNFKQAIRRSYRYAVVPTHEPHWFFFRERTAKEIADLRNKNKKASKEMMEKSPQSSGYETDENSSIPSSKLPEPMDSSVMGINTEIDPFQQICNKVFNKFFPPGPQMHQVEYGGNDPHQELVNPTPGELECPGPLTGLQGDEYLMNNSPENPVNKAVGTLQSADTLAGLPKDDQGVNNFLSASRTFQSANTFPGLSQGEYVGLESLQETVSPVAATLQSLGSFNGLQGGEFLMNNSPQETVSGTTGTLQSTGMLDKMPHGEYLMNNSPQETASGAIGTLQSTGMLIGLPLGAFVEPQGSIPPLLIFSLVTL